MMINDTIAQINGVDLCFETFGERDAPAVLLVSGAMTDWPEELCERLTAGPRFVVRYDIRDTGRSACSPPGAPPYSLRDLVADAVGLLNHLGLARAHVVARSAGGWIGQLMALDHPERVASLTLLSTRPTAPGPNDPDLPEHTEELMEVVRNTPEPDWSDPDALVEYLLAYDRAFASRPLEEAEARAHAVRVVERTRNVKSAVVNMAFIDHGARWRERLSEVRAPTLVIHGTEDPFFPYGNAEAMAREIPNARLVPVERMGHDLPRFAWDVIVPAILRHTA